ncbi:ATP-dependent Clp protease proteolytic subunit [Horticoccus luteus]|uniref:ATP-dependent Clp protease proteolytic subunit n=1 Tax=Horticoccus luteus TaxID=2862869 RepID=A0A8F9TX88_9BACT|nr:NfeD family protein [Horticoccus luteus]QYM79428.1 ATP-dependent Clp protease proteolytic subunit [Horticoccus luteus]
MHRLLALLGFGLLAMAGVAAPPAGEAVPVPAPPPTRVVVIPVREEIAKPQLYIIRRGLKEAIEQKADVVVLDMKTPGGALDVTFAIMEALQKFPGRTITFVNDQALSAGAFISATTDEIWFAPRGKIGAAAPVNSNGQDIDKTMKQKVVSFLRAEVRSVSEGKGYRGQVVSAMLDEDYELKIGDIVLKPKGELLTLTASEAMKEYGEPPHPLLGAGIADNIDDLLQKKFGARGFTVTRLDVTWSERLSVFLNALSPVLLGLGLLALFIEFKTPGFGIFGVSGITLLAVVFLGHYVAGFSGHEPMLVFAVGLLLLGVEVFFFPGVVVMAVSGLVLMLGSLVWAMTDLWPGEPVSFSEDLIGPLQNLGLGIAIAVGLGFALVRFLPRGLFWDRMILGSAIGASAQDGGVAPAMVAAPLTGREGVTVSALRPAGQVEVDGRRFEARVEVGALDANTRIVVTRRTDFGLVVEKLES